MHGELQTLQGKFVHSFGIVKAMTAELPAEDCSTILRLSSARETIHHNSSSKPANLHPRCFPLMRKLMVGEE